MGGTTIVVINNKGGDHDGHKRSCCKTAMKPVGQYNPDTEMEPHMVPVPEGLDPAQMEAGMVYEVPAQVTVVDGQLMLVGLAGGMYAPGSIIPSEMETEMEDEMEDDDEMGDAAAVGFLSSIAKRVKRKK